MDFGYTQDPLGFQDAPCRVMDGKICGFFIRIFCIPPHFFLLRVRNIEKCSNYVRQKLGDSNFLSDTSLEQMLLSLAILFHLSLLAYCCHAIDMEMVMSFHEIRYFTAYLMGECTYVSFKWQYIHSLQHRQVRYVRSDLYFVAFSMIFIKQSHNIAYLVLACLRAILTFIIMYHHIANCVNRFPC